MQINKWKSRIVVKTALLVLGLACWAPAERSGPGQGIVVMAHGGTPSWNEAVLEAVEPLRRWCPVEVAFGMADRESLQQAVSRLEARGVSEIAVVRLFVSGESFLEQTEYFLGVRPEPPDSFLLHPGHGGGAQHFEHLDQRPPPRFVSSREHPIPAIETSARLAISRQGLYDAPAMAEVIVERVQALSREPGGEAVLVLAHGEGDDQLNARWLERLDELAGRIREQGFREVRAETLREDWRDKRLEAEARIREFVGRHRREGARVIVVPFRVFGFGPYRAVLEGLEYVADGRGLLPHPEVTRWLREQASRCFEEAGFANPLASLSPE